MQTSPQKRSYTGRFVQELREFTTNSASEYLLTYIEFKAVKTPAMIFKSDALCTIHSSRKKKKKKTYLLEFNKICITLLASFELQETN